MKNKDSIWAMLAMFLMIALFACLTACTSVQEHNEEYPNPWPTELSEEDWEALKEFWIYGSKPPEGVSRYK